MVLFTLFFNRVLFFLLEYFFTGVFFLSRTLLYYKCRETIMELPYNQSKIQLCFWHLIALMHFLEFTKL